MTSVHAFSHVEWDPERFGIGIRQIDDQHKTLIAIINELSALVQHNYTQHAIQRAARSELNTTSAHEQYQQQQQQQEGAPSSMSPAHHNAMGGSTSMAGSPYGSPQHRRTASASNSYAAGMSPSTPAGAGYNSVRAAHHFNNSGSVPLGAASAVMTASGTQISNANTPMPSPQSLGINATNAHRLAQGQPDFYTPASHLRSFPSCYQKGSDVSECLAKLVTYALRSLSSEDHILETYGYADRATQVQEHEAFGEQICRYHMLSESYALEEGDLLHLLTFLKLWVKEHIPRDRRYAPLLLEKGIGV